MRSMVVGAAPPTNLTILEDWMNDIVFWLWAPSLLTIVAIFGIVVLRHDTRAHGLASVE